MLSLSLPSYHCEETILLPNTEPSCIQQLISYYLDVVLISHLMRVKAFLKTKCPPLSIEEEAADAMDTMETKYTDIIIYACGFLALIMAIVIVVLCRMQVQPRREPFDALPVQKLSKFPLRRQVQGTYVCLL